MAALPHRPGGDQLTAQTPYKALAGGFSVAQRERDLKPVFPTFCAIL